MQITDGTTLIELPDLVWQDEYQHSDIYQSTERSLSGALILSETTATGGRPITLAGGLNHAWLSKTAVDALQALIDQADTDLTLTLDDARVFVCRARRPLPLVAKAVVPTSDPAPADDYFIEALNLIEVSP